MNEYMNKGIKEVITKFPAVGNILGKYNIGCVTCNVGTCLLKDIVEIHNLSADDEQALLAGISRVIYPDKPVELPRRQTITKPKQLKYSPPMKRLVDEHVLIKQLLAAIPKIIETLNAGSDACRKIIADSVDFIRSYADKYHHAKEEKILFKYFDENLDIIKAMHLDHEKGRGYVRGVLDALQTGDVKGIVQNLNAYRELLTEHIKKEDEILYPWLDRGLSTKHIGEMSNRFAEVDKIFGNTQERYERFINGLNERLAETRRDYGEVKKEVCNGTI